jgi:hypothetical protein
VASSARHAFRALALDERRSNFVPTSLDGAYEVWFRGVHSDVGGGNTNLGLNNITLRWMARKALFAGVPVDPAKTRRRGDRRRHRHQGAARSGATRLSEAETDG